MRPSTLDEVVGQKHILKSGSPLLALATPVEQGAKVSAASVLLSGPPGTGKTTLAQVVARSSGRRFVELRATTARVNEARELVDRARNDKEHHFPFRFSTISRATHCLPPTLPFR